MTEEKGNSFSLKQQKLPQNKKVDKNRHAKLTYSIETLFKKHFTISEVSHGQTQTYTLPESESMFKEPPWRLDNLQMLKDSLNEMKSRLNNFNLCEWQQHTNQMNKAGDIISAVKKNVQGELVTQAWCKFYEIASNFFLVPLNEIRREENGNNFTSVHLCEAPGAFVTALNHWLKTNAPDVRWNWLATTLNPYCEGNSYNRMVADDRFIRHTLKHWCFGADNTGDIMDLRNLDVLVERCKLLDGGKRILLITADGSVDCTDVPGEQESAVAQLHLCETVACMHLLQKGGNFLLKLFTLFEHQSVCLMYLLSCVFQWVTVTKPASSKPGNSEMYVVCINFKGRDYVAPYLNILRQHCGNVSPTKAMFHPRDIPGNFLRRLEECNEFFKHHQCQVIKDNISMFRAERYNDILFELKHVKRIVANKYLRDYRLSQIDSANEIVGREILEKSNSSFMNKKWRVDSYNERCKKQDLEPREHLSQICNEAREIESPAEKSYTWHLRAPETLEIQTGRSFNKIRSSHFCDSKIHQILNKIDDIVRDTQSTICFPTAEITREQTEQIDPTHEILSFQFVRGYDSHRMIAEFYDRLEKFQTGQTLVLVGYSLLTQLNIGLLHLLSGFFDKITVEICDNEGYRIKLEIYRRNDKVLNDLREILTASHNARKDNMTIWSIIPITILYEKGDFSRNNKTTLCEILAKSSEAYCNCIKNPVPRFRSTPPHVKMKCYLIRNCTRFLSTGQHMPKVCIVGSGPAGFYAAQQLLKSSDDVRVDILEKLPVPFGLVRFGVAPDHPEVKNVINTFHKTATNPRVQFLGNVNVGTDITVDQLRDFYHAVLLAYGAQEDRLLNIPGEYLNNIISGRRFVGWYNGVPADKNLNINLDVEEVVVLGQGNVAIDITRILLTPVDKLKNTDITSFALERLSRSRVRKVSMVGRRGPLQAAFTIAELRELLKLENCKKLWRPQDFTGVRDVVPTLARPRKRLMELMLKSLEESVSDSTHAKELNPIFLRSPVEFHGGNELRSVRFAVSRLRGDTIQDQVAEATDEFETIPCGLALRSIGFKSVQIDSSIPFDARKGRVVNKGGKVDGNLYSAGWAATGPVGVILSTMTNAFQVGNLMCKELTSSTENKAGSNGVRDILNAKSIQIVSYGDWQKIDRVEQERGKQLGKTREKIVDVAEMLDIAAK